MPIPSISFRLAIVAMLAVLGVWFLWLTEFQHDILIMHFAGSAIARLMIIPLPFALLTAFIGWNKGYFRKTYLVMGGLWVIMEIFTYAMGIKQKHPQVDLEALIMAGMIAVSLWFAYELVRYVKEYRNIAKQ